LSLFSSLHHLISHRKQQFLSAITNNYKFPVTTPLFWAFFNFVQLSKLYGIVTFFGWKFGLHAFELFFPISIFQFQVSSRERL
jgi:hypothetical protein